MFIFPALWLVDVVRYMYVFLPLDYFLRALLLQILE